jgi:hypothetical protein
VWGTVGPFGSYATFYAQWKAARTVSSSGTDWTITNLELDGLIRNGRTCDSSVCSGWGWTFTAKFYDSHSKLITSLTVPAGICWTYPIIDSNSYWLTRCKTSLKFHTSDTSVVQLARAKFTWNVGVLLYGYFYTPGWSYSSGYVNFG